MEVQVSVDVWAGIDAGKLSHHCVVINEAGSKLLSRKVSNDVADLLCLIDDVAGLAAGGVVQWAVDLNAGGAAMLIALLVAREQNLVYIPGRVVHHPPPPTVATAKPMRRTRRSSPTKLGCAAICNPFVSVTK